MNISIFEGALYYYYAGLVDLSFENQKEIWFKVDGEDITFSYGKGYLDIHCTCEYCGKKGVHNMLCARKLACIFWLEHKYLIKQRKKK